MILLTMLLLAAPPPTVEVSDAVRAQMSVLTDGDGHYIAYAPSADGWDNHLFYGTDDELVQVPVVGWSRDRGRHTFNITFIDYRFYHREIDFARDDDGAYRVRCGKSETVLEPVDDRKSKKLLKKAEFHRNPFQWRAFALARNDEGTYFYVDRGRFDDNNKLFRVFIGPKGQLENMKLTNLVHDSEGAIFATTTGTLRLVLNKGEYWWVSGDKKQRLTIVPIDKNQKLIYRDLGVYVGQRFGTPCDDL